MDNSDEELYKAVEALFNCYDQDKSGTLDIQEVEVLINDALKYMHESRKVTQADIEEFIGEVDTNNDQKINKEELFQIFKKVVSDYE